MDNVNSVVQDCLQSTTNTDDTDQVNGRCLSPKSSQVASVNVVCGYTQRAQSYETARTFINTTGLPLDSSENDFTQSLYVNEKRKASADMTARSLRQCLSRSRLAYGSNNNFPTSTSASDFNNDFQSHTHHQASDTTEGLDTSHSPLLPIDQTTTGFSQPSRDAPVVLQHTEQQYDLHSTEGTSINNGGSSQSTPTSYVAEPVRLTTRRKSTPNMRTRSVRRRLSTSGSQSGSFEHGSQQPNVHQSEDQSLLYEDLGDCNERCRYCNAAFWHGERLKGHRDATYHLCCGGGKIVEGLIEFLDTHNELVQVFRTARDKCAENDVPEFKVRLYNGNGARGYELPTSQAIGAIVFDSGPTTESDYDIIIEYRDGPAKRINKLHQSYMSLQFPLIFVYGQPGYHTSLMTRSANPNERMRRVSMNAFYTNSRECNYSKGNNQIHSKEEAELNTSLPM
ncbi:hypothetical protein CTI12_AA290610 [Artemisia annua]|uniref:C2H2-type domain-containing protein n=1 Tax=Artemisia annua TaxID=35608 RepID=A0A2U1N9S5_ARTAN|nr:hypothetical protein CTI12_AA290610 [Artemisia annua]